MSSQEIMSNQEIPPLVTMGDPRLARPSAPVSLAPQDLAGLLARVETLAAAMHHYQGIGIAAPQIGWFDRFFLTTVIHPPQASGDAPSGELQGWVNPELVEASSEHNWAWEGCLSVPGWQGWVRRPAAVAVRGYTPQGEPIGAEFTGWNARVWQHEFDHLEGLLFPYRISEPRHLVTLEELQRREQWPADWPASGARDAPLGEVLPE